MPASDAEIQDLAISTQKNLGPVGFYQIAQEMTNYEVGGYFLDASRIEVERGTGNGFHWNVMMDSQDNTRFTKLFEGDEVLSSDVMREANAPWRHMVTDYCWDRRAMLMNSGEAVLTNLIQIGRVSALLGQVKTVENTHWSKPADSSDDRTPWGLFTWLVSSATRGFNGGNAAGFSAGPGGLDASVDRNARWRNYTDRFSAITKADLVGDMRRAHREIDFQSPVPGGFQISRKYRIYTGIENLEGLEALGEAQNENLGKDIASMDGQITFRGNAIVRVNRLDAAYKSDRPVLFVNRDTIKIVVLSGNAMRESAPDKVGGAHNVMAVFIDTTYNYKMTDRRRNAYLSYAA